MASALEITSTRCRFCFVYNDAWLPGCPACGKAGGLIPDESFVAAETGPKYRTLAQVEPSRGEYAHSGMPTVDRVFGVHWKTGNSGIHIPSVMILAGPPGNGKSSLLLKYAASCSSKVLYLLSEHDLSGLRDTADRCQLTDKQLDKIHIENVESVAQGLDLARSRRSRVVIFDSFSDLVPPEGDKQGNAVRLMKTICKDSRKHMRGVICIAHVNREDEIALARRVEHEADAVARLDAFGEIRLLHCPSKNRHGPVGVRSWFKMGVTGPEPCDEPEEDPTKGR